MTIEESFGSLGLEYSVGANVIIVSIINKSIDNGILIQDSITKVAVNYSYNDEEHTVESAISPHVNSILLFLTDLPAETEIKFRPLIYYTKNDSETFGYLTQEITTTTLPYGNITYNLIASDNPANDNIVRDKIEEVIGYVNAMGAFVDTTFDTYAPYAKTIPIKYNSEVQTASAYYYRSYAQNEYGLVQTSGGSYSTNHVIFHELRHRYGITSIGTHLLRDQLEGRSDLFSYIKEEYSVIHDAIKFETGRSDAKVWIFDAHSNIPEGSYTDNGNMNYLAANYLKALIWYTSHSSSDPDNSMIRCEVLIDFEPTEIPDGGDTPDTPTPTPDTPTPTPTPNPEDDGINKCYFSTLIKPYIIDEGSKVFLLSNVYSNGIINKSLNLTLYPYSDIVNNIYVQSDINPITTFINTDVNFRLQSKLGFDNNTISILNTFEFPGKIYNEDNYYAVDIHGDYNDENYVDQYVNQVTRYYNSFYMNENISNELDQDDFRDELDVENIRTTGFIIQIANDIDFNEIIFESVINTDNQNDNFIYDFSFSLDNIVNDWSQLNEILVIRSRFIDKRLNIVITGNNVVLTKEWFKYLINDIKINHIIFDNQNNLINSNFMEINKGFNFIDKLNCIIVDKKETNNVETSNISNTSTQIIYKSVFYKVQDLQNMRIRQGVTQNIGLNLGEYMNKVDLFILNIEGNNIKESSRNDINVIFNINANLLESPNGIYNILDQNFEYISSGNYMVY